MGAYIHQIPGRIRVRIDRIKGNEQAATEIEKHFRSLRGIRNAVANRITGSVLIHYDPARTDVDRLLHGVTADRPAIASGGSRASRTATRLVTRTILTYLAEAAVERAVVGLIAAML